MAKISEVKGKHMKHEIMLYALSTCIWCKKTKKLLDDLDVTYHYVFVDHLSGREEEEIMEQIKKYNPDCTFPTMVINGKKVISGFKEPEIKKALA